MNQLPSRGPLAAALIHSNMTVDVPPSSRGDENGTTIEPLAMSPAYRLGEQQQWAGGLQSPLSELQSSNLPGTTEVALTSFSNSGGGTGSTIPSENTTSGSRVDLMGDQSDSLPSPLMRFQCTSGPNDYPLTPAYAERLLQARRRDHTPPPPQRWYLSMSPSSTENEIMGDLSSGQPRSQVIIVPSPLSTSEAYPGKNRGCAFPTTATTAGASTAAQTIRPQSANTTSQSTPTTFPTDSDGNAISRGGSTSSSLRASDKAKGKRHKREHQQCFLPPNCDNPPQSQASPPQEMALEARGLLLPF